ncbi:MAG: zf-HC2 domain-containing protein [Micromonosporaceae bacterium]|nr:zf-HC2 domain-containing protein [Micromonosporaceae bacterium]
MRSQPPGPPASPGPYAPGPCPYELDDGAYILGALSPAERAEYERHLATCPPCRDAIAQLAVLPGLLGRLDPQTAQRSVTAPPTLLPRVLAAVRAQRAAARRRRLLTTVAGVVAAVALALVVGIGVKLALPAGPAPLTYRPMSVGDNTVRVDAEIGIQEQSSGTMVSVRCLYHDQSDHTWQILLIVYPREEEAESIGSWVATGGQPVEVSAITRYSPDQIDRIELQTRNHTTIAWWSP